MHLLTIFWTLICAAVIIGYPIYLINKSSTALKDHEKSCASNAPNTVELLSFDIREQLPNWSFTIDVPEITEEVLDKNPILFYLESDDTCLKLPLNNTSIGYTAKVYKNVGKVYVTFKSLKDGVTNFYVPTWHLKKLKILIIRSKDARISGNWENKHNKSVVQNNLKSEGININDYEDILGYLSNIASIDFKGHFVAKMPLQKKAFSKTTKHIGHQELYHSA